MKINLLKKIFLVLLLTFLFTFNNLFAQDITTVKALNSEIAENLDLKLVASLFGESKNLEDFENKLNDYEIQASNLDLNNDEEVDYLRVMDILEEGVHIIVIQAVIGVDKYQDVAEIDVQKNSEGLTEVQIIGDSDLYGDNYIVEPSYISTPEIFLWFLGVHYRVWYSPYYWGHYPKRHRHWKRHSRHHYKKRSRKHRNIKTTYKYAKSRRNKKARQIRKRKKNFNRVVVSGNSKTEYRKKRRVRKNWKTNRKNSSSNRVYVHSRSHDNKPNKYNTSTSLSNRKSKKNKRSSWGTSDNSNSFNKSKRKKSKNSYKNNRKSYKKKKNRKYKSKKRSRKASKAKKSRSYKSSKPRKSRSKSKSSKSDRRKRR